MVEECVHQGLRVCSCVGLETGLRQAPGILRWLSILEKCTKNVAAGFSAVVCSSQSVVGRSEIFDLQQTPLHCHFLRRCNPALACPASTCLHRNVSTVKSNGNDGPPGRGRMQVQVGESVMRLTNRDLSDVETTRERDPASRRFRRHGRDVRRAASLLMSTTNQPTRRLHRHDESRSILRRGR